MTPLDFDIFSLPSLTGWWLYAAVVAGALTLDLLRRLLLPRHSFTDKHVIVTGGSSGIGKALALELLRRGARVTLLARTEARLKAAVDELKPSCAGTARVRYSCASITDSVQLDKAVAAAAAEFGAPHALIANAGAAAPGLFLEMPVSTFESQIDLNYLGTVRSIKAVVPAMVEQGRGHIIVVASAAANVGFLGYSSYAPTKWALRGLADCLRNELLGFGIAVQIAYPPDTETPGFAHENETKPPETVAMVPVDIYPAERVAKALLNGAEGGLYHIPSPDPVINAMSSSMAGVSPRAYPLIECMLLPLFGLIEWLAYCWFDRFAHKYARRHAAEQKARQKSD